MVEITLYDSEEVNNPLVTLICSAADVCRKPLIHALVELDQHEPCDRQPVSKTITTEDGMDLRVRLECRDSSGERCGEHDLELEIYQSGHDLNLMLGWWNQAERPLLWHGQHPVWMNAETGRRCPAPADGAPLEALARRLRALLV